MLGTALGARTSSDKWGHSDSTLLMGLYPSDKAVHKHLPLELELFCLKNVADFS